MKYNWPVLLVLTLTPCLQQNRRPGFIKGTWSFEAMVAGRQAVLGPRLDSSVCWAPSGRGSGVQPGQLPCLGPSGDGKGGKKWACISSADSLGVARPKLHWQPWEMQTF